jgi:hypothetical protein
LLWQKSGSAKKRMREIGLNLIMQSKTLYSLAVVVRGGVDRHLPPDNCHRVGEGQLLFPLDLKIPFSAVLFSVFSIY